VNFEFSPDAEGLREKLRELIGDEIPQDFLGACTHDPADHELTRRFCRRLAEEGLLALSWPPEYGGRGGSVWEQTVVREEMWAHHEPRGSQYMGLNWVGPAIMAFGTPQQKSDHLPPIASGEAEWCQGFSEPDAGSDLASLTTKATRVTGGWSISGQKIWTSFAGWAQWCVLAGRVEADPGAGKHAGITLFLVPMTTPGVTVRPIDSSIGPHHLHEVFFDDVVVDDEAVLGGVGQGWRVMRHALTFERVGIARYARCELLMSALEEELGENFDELPRTVRARWVQALIAVRVARLLAYRTVFLQAGGAPADTAASTARIAATLTDQQVAETLCQALDGEALQDGAGGGATHGAVEHHWRYAQAATVSSGTIEMQRMIVGRATVGGD
jgi:alkylation response protein AidB-like acyl-CoA dehydrogenase